MQESVGIEFRYKIIPGGFNGDGLDVEIHKLKSNDYEFFIKSITSFTC